jgi:hypothetical protein
VTKAKEPAGANESRPRKLVDALRSGVTATATAVTAVLGIVFVLAPSLRPLPRDKIEASVSIPAIERSVTVCEWAERQYPADPAAAMKRLLKPDNAASRDQFGTVVYVRLKTDGFQHRAVGLRARVYDWKLKETPVPNSSLELLYPSASDVKVEAPSRSSMQLMLLDDLTDLGRDVFVRVEAYDDAGILSYADSDKIASKDSEDERPPACDPAGRRLQRESWLKRIF